MVCHLLLNKKERCHFSEGLHSYAKHDFPCEQSPDTLIPTSFPWSRSWLAAFATPAFAKAFAAGFASAFAVARR